MYDEHELVTKILNGDDRAFQLLVKQYQRLVWHVVAKMVHDQDDVQDISQEVFVQVYQKLESFRFDAKLSTWIATIAYRYTLNHLKKKRLDLEGIPDHADSSKAFGDDENPEKLASSADMRHFVHGLIDKLPAQYKTVLTLFHLEEFNYEEIREITGMPEGTVKNYLFRARKLLKEALKKNLGQETIFEK